jgi:hypothetical protein
MPINYRRRVLPELHSVQLDKGRWRCDDKDAEADVTRPLERKWMRTHRVLNCQAPVQEFVAANRRQVETGRLRALTLQLGSCEQGFDNVGVVQGARRPGTEILQIQADPVIEQGDQLPRIRLRAQETAATRSLSWFRPIFSAFADMLRPLLSGTCTWRSPCSPSAACPESQHRLASVLLKRSRRDPAPQAGSLLAPRVPRSHHKIN